jgi:alanyl-tRNA synthetase
MALFDEKYGEEVRVLSIGEFSKELCGGTHVKNTGEIGLFKITQEAGIASGVRRIEAITGLNSMAYLNKEIQNLKEIQDALKSSKNEVLAKVKSLLLDVKTMQKQIEEERKAESLSHVDDLLNSKEIIEGISLVRASVDQMNMGDLRDLTEKVLDKLQSGVVVLATTLDDKVNFSIMISKDLLSKGLHAGKMIKEMATLAGGGGGGRPDMAQAGGKLPEKKDEALEIVNTLLKKQLNS